MSTVQDFLNESVKLIDDFEAIDDYEANYFGFATSVIGDLMKLKIGIEIKEHRADTGTEPYTATDTYYKPFTLPAEITAKEQILSVRLDRDGTYSFIKTETHVATLYLLIPYSYTGTVIIRYRAAAPKFTALTDVIPISDDALYTVAIFGLAKLLSYANAEEMTSILSAEYEKRKAEWKKDDINPKKVKAVYNY